MNQASRDFTDAIAKMQSRGIAPPAGTSLVLAPGSRPPAGMEVVSGKYIDWFDQQRGVRPLEAPAVKRAMTERELGERTVKMLKDSGQALHAKIEKRLPTGHRMQQAILAQLLNGVPYLGTCRIGRVPLARTGPKGAFITMAEFYVTNFDANLSTQAKHFYNYSSPERALEGGAKFFGLGIITDLQGRRLSFDKRFGNGGVYYQTKDEALATYAIAAISTGKSFSELLGLDKANDGKSLASFKDLQHIRFAGG